MDYEKRFYEVLGEPHNATSLREYICFVTNRPENDLYTENHHIFPKSVFGPNDHTFTLSYTDHIEAHRLLAEAYPIREFTRPLNFMLPKDEKITREYRNLIAKAAKENWKRFKKSPQYQIWRKRRSSYMSNIMKNGLAKKLSDKRFSDPEERKKVSDQFKTLWQDEEYRERVIASMIKEKQSPAAKERMRNSAKFRWDNMTDQERTNIKKKMKQVNSDVDKRKRSGLKNKEKWKDPKFRAKMSKRNHGSNSATMKEKWKDPEFRKMMLEARSKKNETKQS